MNNPCHDKEIKSLNRIEGQIRGIKNMIEERKYCVEILNQVSAVRSALSSVEGKILKRHIRHCIKDSIVCDEDFDEKIDELLKVLKR
jgi:CsoR family transcriptional regulator, copper-sensing transcriptional repressor